MLLQVLLELLYRALVLGVTFWAAHYLTTTYIEALLEFTRAYLTVLDLVYAQERLPLRV